MKAIIFATFLAFLVNAAVAEQRCVKDYISDNMLNNQYQGNKSICERCMEEHNVSFEDLTKLEESFPKNPPKHSQCYFKCYSIIIGTMSAEGTFDDEFVVQVLNQDLGPLAKECLNEWTKLTDPCERAYTVYRCISLDKKKN